MILNGATAATVERFIALQSEAARLAATWQRIKDYRAYYDGEHPVTLTERQKEYLGPILTEYDQHVVAYNLCRVVVDTLRERLRVEGFIGADAAGDALAAQVWTWWNAAQMDNRQITVYRRALRDAKTYVIVAWNTARNMPEWIPNRAYDGDTGVTFHRDPESGVPLLAVKYWRKADIMAADYNELRRTVYLPNMILRHKPDSSADYGWRLIDPAEGKPVEYWTTTLTAGGAPLGLPVIEFENAGELSELSTVIGLQNAVNKCVVDLLAAADTTAFQRLILQHREGVFPEPAPTDDDEETADDLRVGPGRILEVFDGATMIALESGDLTQIIAALDKFTGFIAGASRTPLYYLQPFGGADVPSGEALKQLESGLISRATERFTVFGDAWLEAMRVAARLWLALGHTGIDPEAGMTVNWASPAIRNELYDAQVAQVEAGLGVPQEVLWEKRLGYSPAEVADMRRLAAAAQARKLATVLGSLNSGAISDETTGTSGGGPIDGRGSSVSPLRQ